MIGTLIFADLPLAIAGGDSVLWGWNDVCPEKGLWSKQPANEGQWSAQVRASNIWNKQVRASSQWQAIDKSQSAWTKQKSRVENHNKC